MIIVIMAIMVFALMIELYQVMHNRILIQDFMKELDLLNKKENSTEAEKDRQLEVATQGCLLAIGNIASLVTLICLVTQPSTQTPAVILLFFYAINIVKGGPRLGTWFKIDSVCSIGCYIYILKILSGI